MTKFTAPTIELALLNASKELKCSIVDLEYEILEKPRKGFLGLGKRDAKIVVSLKQKNSRQDELKHESKFVPKSIFGYDKYESRSESKYETNEIDEKLLVKINNEINELFALLPIKLSKIEVSKFEKNTILIHFKGTDAALLIGERGYRYKAISYLLFNWLNAEYGVNVRLEIESFLASQEAMMAHYLAPIIEELKDSNEPFATKTFDGILAYIALKELRAKLRGKNVVLKTNENDENYILIQPLKK